MRNIDYPPAYKVIVRFCVILLTGFVFWQLDTHFCASLRPLYLHAFWHVCTGYAAYYAQISILWRELRDNGKEQDIVLYPNWIWIPKLQPAKPTAAGGPQSQQSGCKRRKKRL